MLWMAGEGVCGVQYLSTSLPSRTAPCLSLGSALPLAVCVCVCVSLGLEEQSLDMA